MRSSCKAQVSDSRRGGARLTSGCCLCSQAVQSLSRQLKGLAFVRTGPVCQSDPCQPSSSDYSILLKNGTHSVIVVWSTLSFPHNVQLMFSSPGCYDAVDWMGRPLPQACTKISRNEHLNIMVEDSPIFLTQRLKRPKLDGKLKLDDDDSAAPAMVVARKLSRVITCDHSADSTAILMGALNVSNTVVNLLAGRTCISEPLLLASLHNLTVNLGQGAELQAKRGSHRFGTLLSLESCTDVTIQGASGGSMPKTTMANAEPYMPSPAELARPMLRMWRADYANASIYTHSEHRHALSIHGCSQIKLRNLRICYSGGDGIYVSSLRQGFFTSLTIDHNFRQGMSVIEAQGLIVTESVFAFTRGTAPMAGIDFEVRPYVRAQQSTHASQYCRIICAVFSCYYLFVYFRLESFEVPGFRVCSQIQRTTRSVA
jgi:hypothetical protein